LSRANGKYILAHDLGTSGNKAVLLDLEMNVVAKATANYPIYYPEKGWAEQDPGDWWRAVVETTRRVLEEAEAKPPDVAGLTFSTQMAGTLPVDESGEPLMRCMIWLDTRAAKQAAEIWKGLVKVAGYNVFKLFWFLRITGGCPGLAGKDVITKILWVKEERPELYVKTHKFLDCKDYLLFRCTGNFITSRDLANVSWMMDTRPGKMNWSDAILRKFGIDRAKLPEIRASTDLAGELTREAASELGLEPGTPVVVGAGDITSAAVGSGAVAEYEFHAYLGTSSWLAFHVRERKKDIRHYMGSICSARPDMYLCVAEQETACACLDWLRDVLYGEEAPEDVYREFDKLAEEVEPGARGLIFTPWLFGERAPLDDPTVRGAFLNLSLEHKRGHLVRAVMEGVALNLRWALFYMERLGRRAEHINVIGGGVKSDVWCQIMADVLNRPVRRVADPAEAGARGAAMVAAVGLGILPSFEEASKLVRIERVFQPRPENRSIYDRLFEEFKAFYERNKAMYRRLNT